MTERKARARTRANTGVSPLRYASVEMTEFGFAVTGKRYARQEFEGECDVSTGW